MAASAYVVLGVSRTATLAEIRAAFRALAKQFHPDVAGGDPMAEDRFMSIRAAYEVLVDPVRRRDYDAAPDGDTNAQAQLVAILRRRRNERRRARLMRLY